MDYYAAIAMSSVTQAVIYVTHYQNVAATANVAVYIIGIQMTPGGAEGFAAAPVPILEGSVSASACCHTPNCENAEIVIPVDVPEGASVVCGVCAQPITDVTEES